MNRDRILVALLEGVRVGLVEQDARGRLRFIYDDAWRQDVHAYPLSLSLPLTAAQHGHDPTNAFLWGLLPDNTRTLDHYGRLFGVSSGNPVALLSRMGGDCAGAVQFATPDDVERLTAARSAERVQWLGEDEVAAELRSVRQTGIPGTSAHASGQFSLAGAQPKIALLEEGGRWGRPSGRTPSNYILKPPTGQFHGFVENEHFCLEVAKFLSLGAVSSRVRQFGEETAIVVQRFDRARHGRLYTRIHQEDVCQALGVMPTRKYENDGGPSIARVIGLLRDASSNPQDDILRFLRVTALNWVIAATDAHAKNYALLHASGGAVRLAPFYDILSYLPYADDALHRVKLAMNIGGEYLVRRVNRRCWEGLARQSRLGATDVLDTVRDVVAQVPSAVESATDAAVESGLDSTVIRTLSRRITSRTRACAAMLAA
ncbi:MAG TPA: type II toxin-antitoxin system HipA family toxin [Gemmatimonadaceae bacterium]